MSFSYPRLIKREKRLLGIAFLIIIGGFFFLLFALKKEEASSFSPLKTEEKRESGARLWAPPFSPSSSGLQLRQVAEEIALIGAASKEVGADPAHLILLTKTKQWKIVSAEERIYLSFSDKGICFSSNQTPLWFKLGKETDHLFLTLHLWVPIKNEEIISDFYRSSLLVQARSEFKKYVEQADPIPTQALQQLKTAVLWGPDRLIDLYGGESYLSYQGKDRLEFFQVSGEKVLFIDRGEWLVWNGVRWSKSQGDRRGKISACYRSGASSRSEIEVFGEKGLQQVSVGIALGKGTPLRFKADELFTKARIRTPHTLSSKIGAKNQILKVGDWLIKSDSGWKALRRLDEIETYLAYGNKSELFVLDALEKANGEISVKGRVFDGMRTQVEEVIYPLVQKRAKMAPLSKPTSSISSKKPQHQQIEEDEDEDDSDDDDEIGYTQLDDVKRNEIYPIY